MAHSRSTRSTLPALASLAALLVLGRAAAEEPTGAFVAAQAVFEEALRGSSGAAGRAHELFSALVQGDPGNPLYLAYQGSSSALLGRDAWAPWSKWRNTERGLGLLDKALALLGPEHERLLVRGSPVAIETRLVAASTFLAVPGMFNRKEAARVALRDALASPAFEAAPPQIRARLHLQAAALARKDEDKAAEVSALRSALADGAGDRLTEKARSRLAELGQ